MDALLIFLFKSIDVFGSGSSIISSSLSSSEISLNPPDEPVVVGEIEESKQEKERVKTKNTQTHLQHVNEKTYFNNFRSFVIKKILHLRLIYFGRDGG